MQIIELAGSAKLMGEGFGESCRAEIQQLYTARLGNAIEQAAQYGNRRVGEPEVLHAAQACLRVAESYDPDGYAELSGIARAANLTGAQAYAMNALTDLRDYLAWPDDVDFGGGCSSFVVQTDKTTDKRVMVGQTWDLATDNMPFVCVVKRKPKDAPATWCLTTFGCLSLIGMNEEGLAIGTTNLRTTDARIGVCYLTIIHRVLRQRTVQEAAQTIAEAPRAGGHYYYVADRAGQAVALECTARLHHRRDVSLGHHVECNHVLVPAHAPLETDAPKASSLCRRSRLDTLLAEAPPGSLDADAMVRFLSDHSDGDGAICRHDLNSISSNGAVVMSPTASQMRVCHGYPCESEWLELL